MRVLLTYPRTPDSFWSFKHVLRFVAKRAAFPPLGLLTVAADGSIAPRVPDPAFASTQFDRRVIAALFHVAENRHDWSQWQ